MTDGKGTSTAWRRSGTPQNTPPSLVLFAHGKESGPWGSKIKHLADIAQLRGYEVASPDYSDLADPNERVRRLLEMEFPPLDKLVLVGSSMGGVRICCCIENVETGWSFPDGACFVHARL